MVADLIEREAYVPAPVDRVWRVLTTAEHIRSWYAFGGAEVDLRAGGAVRFRWDEHGEFHARVELVEPPHRFVFRLAANPDEPPEKSDSTLVEFTIRPEGEGSRVTVNETGIDALSVPEPEKARHAEYAAMAWTAALEELGAIAAASHG
ncbi:SRPBCC domain-containing protein [Streptomyces pathocidini]|uniref:SRPBCC domain-containing protein n=1 Tax=Streptomyces pathocidini TaxID=1650571 RepID=A0ABW7UVR5_9ACTN|nr:SRPBCC domain-containing protein [Streptomyces pathocidini]